MEIALSNAIHFISFHFTSIRLLITLSLGFNATFPPHIHTDVHIPLINTEIDVFVTFFCSAFIRLPLFVRVCSERAVKLEDGLYQSKSCPNQPNPKPTHSVNWWNHRFGSYKISLPLTVSLEISYKRTHVGKYLKRKPKKRSSN